MAEPRSVTDRSLAERLADALVAAGCTAMFGMPGGGPDLDVLVMTHRAAGKRPSGRRLRARARMGPRFARRREGRRPEGGGRGLALDGLPKAGRRG